MHQPLLADLMNTLDKAAVKCRVARSHGRGPSLIKACMQ